MAAISYVFTLSRVAQMLGEREDLLYDLATNNMEPEDGCLRGLGPDDECIMAFTPFGIENIKKLLSDLKETR